MNDKNAEEYYEAERAASEGEYRREEQEAVLTECLCEGQWYRLDQARPEPLENCLVAGSTDDDRRLVRPAIFTKDGNWQSILKNITHWTPYLSLPEDSGY